VFENPYIVCVIIEFVTSFFSFLFFVSFITIPFCFTSDDLFYHSLIVLYCINDIAVWRVVSAVQH
jgi:hypothetical protein